MKKKLILLVTNALFNKFSYNKKKPTAINDFIQNVFYLKVIFIFMFV